MKALISRLKKRLKSKTVWLGISVQLTGALVLIQANIDNLHIPPAYVGWAAVIVGTAIGILRELTKAPVSDK
jgi:hypothetical protein